MKRNFAALPRWAKRGAAMFLGMALFAFSTGCSLEEEDEGLSGPFGPGQGGPAVGATLMRILTDSSGTSFGNLDYDPIYFLETAGAGLDTMPLFYDASLGLPGELVFLNVTRISGRPDTPCRFAAAVLARDERFAILAAGDRSNANGLEFHQVNLRKDSVFANFYCTSIQNNLGIQISALSLAGDNLGTLQVHLVLNSVRR